ncbi:glycosyltransferase [Rhodobacteraceae bacterium DSL-40]|uniref:glycosyltransferase n=1 Tax=Amaricoccus sp. B4 TaxID=3368557 RepID=UPI000DAC6F5D
MARTPRILFIHDNFPAQFGRFGQWLAGRGWEISFATEAKGAAAEGIRVLTYAPHREPSPETHPYAQPMDKAVLKAQAFARTGFEARKAGYRPDLVVAHSGWGAGMFAAQVFPEARFVAYCEWWYRHPGADVEYLSELTGEPVPASLEGAILEQSRNAPIAMDLAASSAALCPTRFQASQFPPIFGRALTVLHDGVDTTFFSPDAAARRATLGGLVAEGARVVTYATRGMEPHRGFPDFMAALPEILASDPKAVALIAGENRVAYGGSRQRKTDWKAKALAEHDLDPARVIFTGRLSYPDYLALLRRSDAHVYLTVPFVLSWSMLEAMSTGCAMVVSDTAPVLEFADESSARLVDLREAGALAARVIETLRDPEDSAARRAAARQRIVSDLDMQDLYLRKAQFLGKVMTGGRG